MTRSCRECGEPTSSEAETCARCGANALLDSSENAHSDRPISKRAVLLLLTALLFWWVPVVFLAWLWDDEPASTEPVATPRPSAGEFRPASPYGREVRDGRSFGEVLADEMTGRNGSDPALARRFNLLIDSLDRACDGDRERIADQIIVGHRNIQGSEASLLDVAVAFEGATKNGLTSDCPQLFALATVMLEQR